MYLIDSHCHLNLLKKKYCYNNIKNILENAYFSHVQLILTVAISLQDYEESYHSFQEYSNILYSCGIHPLYEKLNNKNNFFFLEKKINEYRNIIAIGETGLDFHYSLQTKNIQIQSFEEHLILSKKYKKPIIIHTRNADFDTVNVLSKKEFQNCTGIIHSFTGNINIAKKFLDLGFYISFSGIVTFKNATYMNEVIKFIPLNKLLIETDSPYLSPEPKRGKCNQPSYLLYIAKHIAKIKNIHIFDLSKEIKKNFYLLFNL